MRLAQIDEALDAMEFDAGLKWLEKPGVVT